MGARRTLAITRKSLGQMANDKRTIAFILIMPVILILVFGKGFGGQPTNIAVAYVNSDSGPAGARILSDLPSGTLDLNSVSDNSSAYSAVQAGTDSAAIVIGPNFTRNLSTGTAVLTVYVDGTYPTIVSAVTAALQSAIEKALGNSSIKSPLVISPQYVYGSSSTSAIDNLAPGVMALVACFGTTIISILILVREKSVGLLERLFATPLRPVEFVVGHALSLSVIAAAQCVVLLIVAIVIFQATFVGSILLALVILILFAVGNIGLGMLISAVTQNEFQAVQTIPLIIFPQLLFSGALFPVDVVPVAWRPLSEVLPLTYAADAMHGVLLRGWGVAGVGWDIVILLVYSMLMLIGATVLVRRQA
jgi:ABC-2 type transport system permease protein